MNFSEKDPQALALCSFTFLHQLRPDWAGRLILSLGLGPEGAALALAANIAGAVCLSLEADPILHRNALRSGSCDFVVKTLDEALRAMKNELRKRLPLSIGLQGDIPAILHEIVERGVLPNLFLNPTNPPIDAPTTSWMQAHGASILPAASIVPEAERYAAQQHWTLHSFTLADPAALRTFDATAASLLKPDPTDALREKWLKAAPRIVQRQRPLRRALWLTEPQRNILLPHG